LYENIVQLKVEVTTDKRCTTDCW